MRIAVSGFIRVLSCIPAVALRLAVIFEPFNEFLVAANTLLGQSHNGAFPIVGR